MGEHATEHEARRTTIGDLVYEAMRTGGWWTLPELVAYLGRRRRVALETGVSARVRELRHSPYNRTVVSRVRHGTSHLSEYALMPVRCRVCGLEVSDGTAPCCDETRPLSATGVRHG